MKMENHQNELDIFNSGCDLVLSHIGSFIVRLEESGEDTEEKYLKLLKMVAGMQAVVAKRSAAKEPESQIIVPDQAIIT